MTYKSRKFDMRALVIVSSVNPLRIWMLDTASAKVAAEPYTDSAEFGSPCVHLTSPHIHETKVYNNWC